MKRVFVFILALLVLSGCGTDTEPEPASAVSEVRVIEAGSGIFSRESVPVPEGWRSASRLFPGRGRAYVSFLDMSAAGYGRRERRAARAAHTH